MKESSEKKKKNEKKIQKLIDFTKNEKIGLGILVFFIVVSPILFSQFSTFFSFEGTGEIGDTIGGITAPFVNLLAAYLIYKSFTAQIRANAQQREDHDEQMKQLNKEHSFNYISNLFKLVQEYYSNNKRDKVNNKKFISNIYLIARTTRKLIDDDLIYGHPEDDFTQKHIDRINTANKNIVNQLLKVKSNLDNTSEFLHELNKSGLDIGIRKFYYREIEAILQNMIIWKITENKYVKDLNDYKIISQHGTQKLMDECVLLATDIFDSGVKLRTIGQYIDY